MPADFSPHTEEAKAWESGYVRSTDGLVCRECGVLITYSDRWTHTKPVDRHDAWHERLDGR